VKQGKKDAYDNARKLTFARKLLFLRTTAQQIVVDTAQAGGICGNADGFDIKSKKLLEPKGSCTKARRDRAEGAAAHHRAGRALPGSRVVETDRGGQGPRSHGLDERGRLGRLWRLLATVRSMLQHPI
jgi:hypothetical protein